MKKLSTLLAVGFILSSVGCQTGKHASSSVARSPVAQAPQIYYAFDESFYKYFEARVEYVFVDNIRSYFGPHAGVNLERALSDIYPGYKIEIGFEHSVK